MSVARLRHELREIAITRSRVTNDLIQLAHVPDASNFTDFATKWLMSEKVEASIAFLTGARMRAMHEPGAAAVAAAAEMHVINALHSAWEAYVEDAELM